jgi:hypothetical protein
MAASSASQDISTSPLSYDIHGLCKAHLAWPPTGGVWILGIPREDTASLEERFHEVFLNSPSYIAYCEKRTNRWVEIVSNLPGAVFIADGACDLAMDALRALDLPVPVPVQDDQGNNLPVGLPSGWPQSVERCILGNMCLAWPKEAQGGLWFAENDGQPQVAKTAYKQLVEWNHSNLDIYHASRAEAIQELGGQFIADFMQHPIVKKIFAVHYPPWNPIERFNDLGQPVLKPPFILWA